MNEEKNIDGPQAAIDYFLSSQEGNLPIVTGNVVLAVAQDYTTVYIIDFVLADGTKTQWQYQSKEERNHDISGISEKISIRKY